MKPRPISLIPVRWEHITARVVANLPSTAAQAKTKCCPGSPSRKTRPLKQHDWALGQHQTPGPSQPRGKLENVYVMMMVCGMSPCRVCVRYASEINLRFKSHELCFVQNPFLICQIVSEFCTECGSIIVVLCAKFLNNWQPNECLWPNDNLLYFSSRWDSDIPKWQ